MCGTEVANRGVAPGRVVYGTEVANVGVARAAGSVFEGEQRQRAPGQPYCPSVCCYAMSGTALVYAAYYKCYAMPGTALAYGATVLCEAIVVLPWRMVHVPAMRCPILTHSYLPTRTVKNTKDKVGVSPSLAAERILPSISNVSCGEHHTLAVGQVCSAIAYAVSGTDLASIGQCDVRYSHSIYLGAAQY
eukprot:1013808-Rhodomonas_salina.2